MGPSARVRSGPLVQGLYGGSSDAPRDAGLLVRRGTRYMITADAEA